MRVRDVYRTHAATCVPDAPLQEVAQLMERADVDMVALVDGGRLVGVFTERDLLRAAARGVHLRSTAARAFATPIVVTADLDEDIDQVAERMVEAGVRRLPVVSAGGRVEGVVTMRDLFTWDVVAGSTISRS